MTDKPGTITEIDKEPAIYQLSHGIGDGRVITDRKALCEDCLIQRLKTGWSILGKEGSTIKLNCFDCQLRRRAGG